MKRVHLLSTLSETVFPLEDWGQTIAKKGLESGHKLKDITIKYIREHLKSVVKIQLRQIVINNSLQLQ